MSCCGPRGLSPAGDVWEASENMPLRGKKAGTLSTHSHRSLMGVVSGSVNFLALLTYRLWGWSSSL